MFSGIELFYLVMKMTYNSIALTWNAMIAVVNLILSILGKKRILSVNEKKRGVDTCIEPGAIAELTEGLDALGKTVISGEDGADFSWSSALAAETAAKIHAEGKGVIVLHQGDTRLTDQLTHKIGKACTLIGGDYPLYDPFRDHDIGECVDQIAVPEICAQRYGVTAKGRRYLKGLFMYSLFVNRRLEYLQGLKSLAEADAGELLERANQFREDGAITHKQYMLIEDALNGGLSGKDNLEQYLRVLCGQLRSICVKKPDRDMISIRCALKKRMVMCVDVSTVTKPMPGYSVMIEEIRSALEDGEAFHVILGDRMIGSCKELQELATERNSRLGMTIISSDLYAQCGAKEEVFYAVTGNSQCCVVLRHSSGSAASAWQNYFGQYCKTGVTYSTGTGRMWNPFRIFGGFQSYSSKNIDPEKIDYRVRAEEIQRLGDGVAFIRRQDRNRIIHTGIDAR